MIQKILIQMRMREPRLQMRHVMAGLVSYTSLSWSTTMSVEAALSPGLSWKRFALNCFVSYEGCMIYQPTAWENSRHLAMLQLGFPTKWRLRNKRRNSVLMTGHYPDLGSTSDWLNQISHATQPFRNTTQIWVVTRHQYEISALVCQMSFGGETSAGVTKCRLFSQANQPKETLYYAILSQCFRFPNKCCALSRHWIYRLLLELLPCRTLHVNFIFSS